jgi:hypothetical protein
MFKPLRTASAVLAAALIASCSSSAEVTTADSGVCSGYTSDYWCSPGGQAEVTQADLAYLATFAACGTFGTAAELARLVAAGASAAAAPADALCAAWFTFALNGRHGRFACGNSDVLFDVGGAHRTVADLEGAVNAALLSGGSGGAALTTFLADANGGANVCVCATGATGATGSWGE